MVAMVAGGSLALNALLGGLLLNRQEGPPGLAQVEARMLASLAAEDRVRFAQVLDAERPLYAPTFAQARAARRAVEAAARGEPFDPAAMRDAMAEWIAWSHLATGVLSETLVRGFTAVSPSGRNALVDGMPKEQD